MKSPRSLRDAVIAVVGASGGLGTAMVDCLSSRGAHIVGAVRTPQELVSPNASPLEMTVECDLRDRDAGDVLAARIIERYGRLDGVVVASGVVAFGNVTEMPDDVIEEVVLTNVLGPLWLAKRVAPHLVASSGFLLMISGVVAEQPLPTMATYGASKAALSSATRSLARELRRNGVTVIDARPPHCETGLGSRALFGTPPRLPHGLAPSNVAQRMVEAIEAGELEIASDQFTAH